MGGMSWRFVKRPMVPHYVIARRNSRDLELLRVSLETGEEVLPVFSFSEVAERFLRSRAPGEGWYVRASSTGEVVSLLCGPYTGIRWISLNPLPGPLSAREGSSVLVSREIYTDFSMG